MTLVKIASTIVITGFLHLTIQAQSQQRARDYGIHIGVLKTGKLNSITDVNGITVGHSTVKKGDSVNTGVTVILPHQGNIFQQKVPAAVYTGNGFGKLAGSTQINELGNIETPIALTNTLSVSAAMNGLITHTLAQVGNEKISSVNAVVGETNDGYLNDIRGRHVSEQNVLEAIKNATSAQVMEGAVGAGTGTVCFGFKGGIGTASRKLPNSLGGYTIGVLVQSNFGGVLTIDGIGVGEYLQKFSFSNELLNNVDGSCMIVVATDAPLDHRNLMRMAKRAMLGLGRTGGIASNGSGDYVIAFSTFEQNRILHQTNNEPKEIRNLHNDAISPLFMATIEATEEAIINSLFAATETLGIKGKKVAALPIQQLLPLFIKEKK
ncbi:P1 family peptidase [Sediminibacterium sp.]|uniref:DmpA family aminopeptidase n=1 Tax=Sediminibacterium sp. TaxID=1917865 RepID=UPI002732E53F|nr:P1 family peptidase [Sediminibacterium sp.]MDP3393145.1 P1 family peptidase [Sediminibacterium sp.]MDP3567747.1 P1 family peptidase [Sediminibacterium sp.]